MKLSRLSFSAGETAHSTHTSSHRVEAERQVREDPFIRDLLHKIYFFDYVVFPFKRDSLDAKYRTNFWSIPEWFCCSIVILGLFLWQFQDLFVCELHNCDTVSIQIHRITKKFVWKIILSLWTHTVYVSYASDTYNAMDHSETF